MFILTQETKKIEQKDSYDINRSEQPQQTTTEPTYTLTAYEPCSHD